MTRSSPQAFGKILVQRGLLSSESLEQAIRLKERQGGSLAVNLVITGAIDDQSLADFYTERYKVVRVTEGVLSRLGRDIFGLIPVEIIYDFGILPLELESEDRLAVGIIDPSEPEALEEAAFFSAMVLSPRLLTIGQMARHYRRMTGKRWKVDWDTVQARRRIQQARRQAETLAEAVDLTPLKPDVRAEHLRALLNQTAALDASLEILFSDDTSGDEEMVIQFISIDGERIHEEELVELTRVKKRAISSTERGDDIVQDQRPRIAARRRGENRRFLDPAQEGEAAVSSVPSTPEPSAPSLPSIIIDTTLMSHEEADAHLEMLVNAPHELTASSSVDIIHPEGLAVGPESSIDLEVEGDNAPDDALDMSISIDLEFDDDIPEVPLPKKREVVAPELAQAPEPLNLASALDASDMSWFSDSIDARLDELAESGDDYTASETDAILDALEARDAEDAAKAAPKVDTAPAEPEPAPDESEPEPEPEPEPKPSPEPVVQLGDSGKDLPRKTTQRLFALPRKTSTSQQKARPESVDEGVASGLAAGLLFKLEEEDLEVEIPSAMRDSVDAIRGATERDKVGEASARALGSIHKRVLLLSLRGTTASPWIQKIGSMPPNILRTDQILTLDGLTCLAAASRENSVFLGPVSSPREDAHPQTARSLELLEQWLDGEVPGSAIVCPICIKGRTIALAYADDGPGSVARIDKRLLAVVKGEMEAALLRDINLHKRRR